MKKLLVLGLLTASSFAFTNCVTCHNGGYQAKLDKYTPAQIEKMMHEFKSGKMSGAMMPGIAKSMSDADIKAAATKFGKK